MMNATTSTEWSMVAGPWIWKPCRGNSCSYLSHDLSFDLKCVAVEASAPVVGIISHLGETEIFHASGFVIESIAIDGKYVSFILTSASVLRPKAHVNAVADGIKISVIMSNEITCQGEILAFDFHYNIGALKIETDVQIATARLRNVDDSISIDPDLLDETSHNPQSDKFNLIPGDTVVALGRCRAEQNELMVVAGEFSATQTGLDCHELYRAEFEISRHGTGGPIINHFGEVIGMSFYWTSFTPFLPINVVSMWWELFKKNRFYALPRLGMKVSNLYLGVPYYLEFVLLRFPNTFKGIVVDKIESDSPAYATGISPLDIIVECDGKSVGGTLEFFELIWHNVGRPVQLTVLRPGDGTRFNVTITVGSVGPHQYNRWPLPEPRLPQQPGRRMGRLRALRAQQNR